MLNPYRRIARPVAAAGARPALAARPDFWLFAECSAVALGFLVRAMQVVGADFPLNDGGMFYAMTRDLQAQNFVPPANTTYNGESIPFAYPPLGFFVAGLADTLTPLSLTTLFQYLPLLFTSLTVLAVYRLARSVLGSQAAIVVAVVAFALTPRSFIWLLMGGGVTRSLGFLLAILALQQVYELYTKRERRHLPIAVVLSALTVLAHLETGWFLAFSIGVFWLVLGRNRHAVVSSGLLFAGVVALTAPWWALVIGEHGLQPFLAANETGGTVFSDQVTRSSAFNALARGVSTGEPLFPVIGALGLLGALVSVASGRYLLPLWWVSIVLLDVRSFATYTSVPVALLAGAAIAEVVAPLVLPKRGAPGEHGAEERGRGLLVTFRPYARAVMVFGALLYYTTFGIVSDNPAFAEKGAMTALPAEQRATMDWIRREMPAESQFLVVPNGPWETSKAAEWFPVLAERRSVATVQGTEWLPGGEFGERIYEHARAWGCSALDDRCLEQWARDFDPGVTHVYLPAAGGRSCCGLLLEALESSSIYEPVYRSSGGSVFERTSSAARFPGGQ